jgi:hypothetical protein
MPPQTLQRHDMIFVPNAALSHNKPISIISTHLGRKLSGHDNQQAAIAAG